MGSGSPAILTDRRARAHSYMAEIEASSVTQGSVVKMFFAYALPSLVGIVSITTSSIVDGLYLGRYVGAEALAAVSVLIPYFTLLFGLTLMLAVGGSVQASVYFGAGEGGHASRVFSRIVGAVVALAVLIGLASRFMQPWLFAALQADPVLHPIMAEYLDVLSLALPIQMIGMCLYYFLRVAERPRLGTLALLIGAISNIALNTVFVKMLGWGVSGAAWATVIGQCIQLVILIYAFVWKQERFRWRWGRDGWGETWTCAKNGFAEFINEVSVGVAIYLINFLMLKRYGVDGVAAFSVVNYLIFVSVMLCFGLIDGVPPMVGENAGAQRMDRVRAVMRIAFACVLGLGLCLVAGVIQGGSGLAGMFLDVRSAAALRLVDQIVGVVWPIFPLHGMNILVALYLTGMRKPAFSSIIALSRSLVLPVILVVAVYHFLPDIPFLVALPAAELLTFGLAIWFYLKSAKENSQEPVAA